MRPLPTPPPRSGSHGSVAAASTARPRLSPFASPEHAKAKHLQRRRRASHRPPTASPTPTPSAAAVFRNKFSRQIATMGEETVRKVRAAARPHRDADRTSAWRPSRHAQPEATGVPIGDLTMAMTLMESA